MLDITELECGYFHHYDSFMALGVDVSKFVFGQANYVDIDIADKVYDDFINQKRTAAINELSEFDLKENEIVAITAILYQEGFKNKNVFIQELKTYIDNGRKDGSAFSGLPEFNLEGGSARDKANLELFVNGRYVTRGGVELNPEDYTEKIYVAENTANTTGNAGTTAAQVVIKEDPANVLTAEILQKAKEIHKYVSNNSFYYSSSDNIANNRFVADGASVMSGNPPLYNIRYIDCSAYVSWVLYECGYSEFRERHYSGLFVPNANFEQIPLNQLRSGDIVRCDGHVEIYAGNGLVYSCGSTNQIRATTPVGMSGKAMYGLRAKIKT